VLFCSTLGLSLALFCAVLYIRSTLGRKEYKVLTSSSCKGHAVMGSMLFFKIAISIADFLSDVFFTYERASDDDRLHYYVSLVSLIASCSAAFLLIYCHIYRKHKGKMNTKILHNSKCKRVFTVISLLSVSQMTLLSLLPWNSPNPDLDGFPNVELLVLTFTTQVLEDIPQIINQIIYGLKTGSLTLSYVSPTTVSVGLSLCSLLVNGLTKLITVFVYSQQDEEEGQEQQQQHQQQQQTEGGEVEVVHTNPMQHAAQQNPLGTGLSNGRSVIRARC
jgi:hypothetical protein